MHYWKERRGGVKLKTRISDYRKGKEEEKKRKKCLERRDEIYRYRSLRNGVLRVSKTGKNNKKTLNKKGKNIG